MPGDLGPEDPRIGVDEADEPVTAGEEAPCVDEGTPEVADAHDDHRPVLVDTHDLANATDELGRVVAGPTCPQLAEVG